MNKIIIMLTIVLTASLSMMVKAQTAAEFLRQKKMQEKYLVKQLAYLKLYAGQVKEGYDLVSEGLHTIGRFTGGEFSLHEAFFGSLSVVKPVIKADKRVMEIEKMQGRILSFFSAMESVDLDVENKEFIRLARRGMELECEKDLAELLLVVSASGLELSDEQRLTRLAKVHGLMLEKLELTHSLYVQVQQLIMVKKKEKQALADLRRLHERD
jgi:hypothetical protein